MFLSNRQIKITTWAFERVALVIKKDFTSVYQISVRSTCRCHMTMYVTKQQGVPTMFPRISNWMGFGVTQPIFPPGRCPHTTWGTNILVGAYDHTMVIP